MERYNHDLLGLLSHIKPGAHLNIKMSYRYRSSHYKDKTVSRLSSLYNGNSIPGKTIFILRRGPRAFHRWLVIVGLLYWCDEMQINSSCATLEILAIKIGRIYANMWQTMIVQWLQICNVLFHSPYKILESHVYLVGQSTIYFYNICHDQTVKFNS